MKAAERTAGGGERVALSCVLIINEICIGGNNVENREPAVSKCLLFRLFYSKKSLLCICTDFKGGLFFPFIFFLISLLFVLVLLLLFFFMDLAAGYNVLLWSLFIFGKQITSFIMFLLKVGKKSMRSNIVIFIAAKSYIDIKFKHGFFHHIFVFLYRGGINLKYRSPPADGSAEPSCCYGESRYGIGVSKLTSPKIICVVSNCFQRF